MSLSAVTDEKKLRRFLHYASVGGTYFPGSRLHFTTFIEDNVQLLRAVLQNMAKDEIFDVIKKVYKENSSPHEEMIPFVLAECARIGSLKSEAFKTAEILCDNTKLFLLFFKFGFERTPKIATGPVFKRLIAAYYLKKDALKLAVEVSQYPVYRGWRHSDLLSMAHIKAKPEDAARQAVFAYISRGVNWMNDKFAHLRESDVVKYLNAIHNFKNEEDPEKVAKTIDAYMLTLDHLNHIHLKQKVVWQALLRRIPLSTLLDNFNFIARSGLFRDEKHWDIDFKTYVKDSMQNNQAINDSKVHPSRVFLEYISYQHAAKFKLEVAVKKHGKVAQKPPALANDITTALAELMNATFKLFTPTKLRYIMCVEPHGMMMRRCSHIPYMLPCQGAAIIAQTYLKIEPNVTLVGPTVQGPIQPIELTSRHSSLKNLEETFCTVQSSKQAPKKDAQSTQDVFDWATKQKKKFDCFILVATSIHAISYTAKLAQYQRTMKLPRAKLVLISLCGAKSTVDQKDVFIVSGFDQRVLPLVANFVNEII